MALNAMVVWVGVYSSHRLYTFRSYGEEDAWGCTFEVLGEHVRSGRVALTGTYGRIYPMRSRPSLWRGTVCRGSVV